MWPITSVSLIPQFAFIAIRTGNDANDLQAIFAREINVALIVCRTAKNCSGAVVHQNEIGDVKGQFLALNQWVLDLQPCIEALFLLGFDDRFTGAHLLAFFHKGCQLRIARRQFCGQRMFRRHSAKACAVNGVWTRGENLKLVVPACNVKHQVGAFTTANPVFLHGPDFAWPAFQRLQGINHIFAVFGNGKGPLLEHFLLNQGPAAPTTTIFNLLVCKHGHVDGIPVYPTFLLINQTSL